MTIQQKSKWFAAATLGRFLCMVSFHAGRSLRASSPPLSACPLRFGILPALASIARSRARAPPSLPHSSCQKGGFGLPTALRAGVC